MTPARRWIPAFGLSVAAWPTIAWYGDELVRAPWALVPLLLAVGFVVQRARRHASVPFGVLPVLCLVGYALTQSVLPPFFAALWIAVAATVVLSALAGLAKPSAGLGGLLLLSLPVIPELQIVLGYPLRVVSGEVAAGLLSFGGASVERVGATLLVAGERIVIDAPCSGVKMWWAALLVAAWWATRARVGPWASLGAALLATLGVVAANGLRAASLVHIEFFAFEFPAWTHEVVGLVSFVACVLPLVWLLDRVSRKEVPCASTRAS